MYSGSFGDVKVMATDVDAPSRRADITGVLSPDLSCVLMSADSISMAVSIPLTKLLLLERVIVAQML